MTLIERLKPAAPRFALLFISGIMWSVVGLLLCRLAISWYLSLGFSQNLFWFLLSIPLALAIYLFGFSRLARVNIPRIQDLPPKPCIFAFMQWWNYPLVAFMISLGIWMRHSPIPKQYLGILYFGIGAALFLASLLYYWALIPGQPLYRELNFQAAIHPNVDAALGHNPESKISNHQI
jgi:hypothetical protein